jgi:hypothetical protein
LAHKNLKKFLDNDDQSQDKRFGRRKFLKKFWMTMIKAKRKDLADENFEKIFG